MATEKYIASSRVTAPRKPTARSRITNGKALLAGDIDQRTLWHRRFRDVLSLFFCDLGGVDLLSEGEKAVSGYVRGQGRLRLRVHPPADVGDEPAVEVISEENEGD